MVTRKIPFDSASEIIETTQIIENRTDALVESSGVFSINRGVTAKLHVSPNGDNSDGSSWTKAFNRIQDALDAASTSVNDCTLILISPHNTYYDINTTGDPTWTANVILKGTHRNWTKIMNTHSSATSIMKLMGKSAVADLNFNLGSGNCNGLIFTRGGWRIDCCMFVGHDLTGAATALHIDGSSLIKHGKIRDSYFVGHVTHMKGLLLDNASWNSVKRVRMHQCLKGIQIVHNDSDGNFFTDLDIGECAIALDIDAGNGQHFHHIDFHGNTINVDDEVGDHHWNLIHGYFPLILLPDNFSGVDLDTHANANTWGSDTEILAAAGRTKPFRIIGVVVEADAAEKFRIRLSSDSGLTHFADVQLEGEIAAVRRVGITLPSGTEEIFSYNTKISGSSKSESGNNTATIWLQVQEI